MKFKLLAMIGVAFFLDTARANNSEVEYDSNKN